jgi:hypothetical protein
MRYESEENYWGIEWLTGELLWGARPDNIKRGMIAASKSKLSCAKIMGIKGLVPRPTFPEGTTRESFRIGQTTYCKQKFNRLRIYSWKKVGVDLLKAETKPTRGIVLRNSLCCAVNVSSIAMLYWQALSMSYVVWMHPSAEPSCLCHACEPAVSGSENTGTTGIVNKWRWLLECRKYGQSNRKLSTFQQRHIALFIFDNSLKAKEAVVGNRWIFSHVKSTCNAQHGIW